MVAISKRAKKNTVRKQLKTVIMVINQLILVISKCHGCTYILYQHTFDIFAISCISCSNSTFFTSPARKMVHILRNKTTSGNTLLLNMLNVTRKCNDWKPFHIKLGYIYQRNVFAFLYQWKKPRHSFVVKKETLFILKNVSTSGNILQTNYSGIWPLLKMWIPVVIYYRQIIQEFLHSQKCAYQWQYITDKLFRN